MTVPSEHEFAEFLATVEPPIHRALVAAYGVVDGRAAAQAAMTWAWEHWAKVLTLTNAAGYLYRVGVTAANRSRPREIPVERPLSDSVAPVVEVEFGLLEALDSLTPAQRVAVILVHGHGYSLRQAADVLNLNPSTVRVHAQRALAKLRNALEPDHAC